MGGRTSRPAPPVVQQLVVDPKPASATTDSISIAAAEGCDRCSLFVEPRISTSSVRLKREFGDISMEDAQKLERDEKDVAAGRLSFLEFKGRLNDGQYYTSTASLGYAQQIALDSEDDTITTYEKYTSTAKGRLVKTRIRKISSGGFSRDTKIQISPIIPLKMFVSINGGEPVPIIVKNMTFYHPSPLRIENVQHDACLSLNDPSDTEDPPVVVLIPLVAGLADTPSAAFMQRVLGNMTSLLTPDPTTGAYREVDVPTGNDWGLTKLLPIDPETNQVKSGMFVWEGLPELEQYTSVDTPTLKRISWRRKLGAQSPVYVMLEKPLTVSNTDYTSLLRFPVTPPERAINEMISGTLTYKCGPCEDTIGVAPNTSSSETFIGTVEKFETNRDPFFRNYEKNYGYNPETLLTYLFGLFVLIATGIGIWAALVLVGDARTDTFFHDLSFAFGKVLFRLFEGAKNKVKASVSPLGGLGGLGGLGAKLGPLAGVLGKMKGGEDQ